MGFKSKPMQKNKGRLPVREKQCSTCPFRKGVAKKYADLAGHLAESALSEASRICHQTGKNNAFHKDTGKPEALCRGARDIQIEVFHSIGFISEPTDAAWDAKCKEIGIA
jgi:hypothetical protein